MLALVRHFGSLPIGETNARDEVFFTLFRGGIVHYPIGWALPLALGVLFAAPQDAGRWWAGTTFAALLLSARVALGILTPALYIGTVDVMEEGPALSVAVLVLVLGLVAPQLSLMARAVRWRWLPTAATLLAALIGVGLLLGGNATSGYDTAHPRPDTLFYGLNADTGEANWATLDPELDEWTKQFLSGETEERTLGGLFGGDDPTKVLTSPAPVAPLKPPSLCSWARRQTGQHARSGCTSPRPAGHGEHTSCRARA